MTPRVNNGGSAEKTRGNPQGFGHVEQKLSVIRHPLSVVILRVQLFYSCLVRVFALFSRGRVQGSRKDEKTLFSVFSQLTQLKAPGTSLLAAENEKRREKETFPGRSSAAQPPESQKRQENALSPLFFNESPMPSDLGFRPGFRPG